ncbi:MAG TPA: lysophospholipid acyltransferase family protein [Candidatus Saccharimonadales bacterium]|nr:lysophospholipid acyltransferase family protein [Candidatus Saccharimonadales bacterium]
MSGIDILWRYNELDSRRNRLTYTGAYCLYKPLAQLALGLKVSGRENIPSEGAVLVASNHRSLLDSLTLPLAVRDRALLMVARDDYSSNPFIQWFFKHTGVIQIKRHGFSGDNYRAVDRPMAEGKAVGIFSEETRGDKNLRKSDPRPNLGPFKPGVASFARRHNAPTVPAAISGQDNPLKRGQRRAARVAFGEPMEPPAGGSKSKTIFLDELRRRIDNLYLESSAVVLPDEPVNEMLAGSDPNFVILSPGLKDVAVRALLADEPSRAELAEALDQALVDREIELATISAIAKSVDKLSDEEGPAADFMAEYRRLVD